MIIKISNKVIKNTSLLNLLPNGVFSIPLLGEVIAVSDEEIVSVDLNHLSDN